MKTIYKYGLEWCDRQEVDMLNEASILDVNVQGKKAYIWASVETNNSNVKRVFYLVGTGFGIPEPRRGYNMCFVKTLFVESLVFHLFEEFYYPYATMD